MTQYNALIKMIKKGKKLSTPVHLGDVLVKEISDIYNDSIARELHFLSLYYGLTGSAMTLEAIGKTQEHPLTRERVRQIIDSVLEKLKKFSSIEYENPFIKTKEVFLKNLGQEKHFLRIEELLKDDYFSAFKKNIKGLIAFFNDCGIRQIAYRKKYYFYSDSLSRKEVVQAIQKENKSLRREKTLEKMSHKAKTVTYVPDEVRLHLLDYAQKKNINLNPLYESILQEFMDIKPYMQTEYVFSRTKSWKARKGKAQWQQIGIYIEKDIFDLIRSNVKDIKKDLQKNVSLMSFICQSFVWHYEKNQVTSN